MKRFISLILAVSLSLPLFSQVRGNISIPDLKGYVTLKCDFHIHTVFSDGTVWPTVRIDEAYREGIDAISITEHIYPATGRRAYLQEIEKLSNVSLKGISHNTSYEIAKPYAQNMDIILIRGSEITHTMPPGHHNAIFLNNSDELDKPDWMASFRAAKAQNAFFFWCHPGRVADQPDTTLWWPEHTRLLQEGLMHGIEVAGNTGNAYYPEAHGWCLEKKLTMIGNSDVHPPLTPFAYGKERTMTLVFAKERTAESIREALNERRTAVSWKEHIIGEEKYLKELFGNALDINVTKTGNTAQITLKNKSDLTFHLKSTAHDARLTYFRNTSVEPVTIAPQSVQTISVRLNDGITGGDVNFVVKNFLVEPNRGMKYTIKI
jgi:hypothetical protein